MASATRDTAQAHSAVRPLVAPWTTDASSETMSGAFGNWASG